MTNTYSYSITGKKALYAFLIGGIGAVIGFLGGLPVTPEFAAVYSLILAVLAASQNFLKHHNK